MIADSLFKKFLTSRNVPYSIKFKLAVIQVNNFNLFYSIMNGNQDLTLVVVDFLIDFKRENLIQQIKRPYHCMSYTFFQNELFFEETTSGKVTAKEESYWEIKYKSKEEISTYLEMLMEFEIMYMNEEEKSWTEYGNYWHTVATLPYPTIKEIPYVYTVKDAYVRKSKRKKMREYLDVISRVKAVLASPFSRLYIETDNYFQIEDVMYFKPYKKI